MKRSLLIGLGLVIALIVVVVYVAHGQKRQNQSQVSSQADSKAKSNDPLSIQALKDRTFDGSDIKTEQTLPSQANFTQSVVSYQSDGLKIFALETVPKSKKPTGGFPAIVFVHGYIPPNQYKTTEKYTNYVAALANTGFIVFKPDLRGHGNSEGSASGAYGSNDYTVDVLNAVASIKKSPDVDKSRIGIWGHSMGGFLTLRALVVDPDLKAGVIWSGVVGSYPDMANNWHHPDFHPDQVATFGGGWRSVLSAQFGKPENGNSFWDSISATSFVKDLAGPVQIHYSVNDSEVPPQFSKDLYQRIKDAGKTAEIYEYPGNDHNLANSFDLAMKRTIDFYNKTLK